MTDIAIDAEHLRKEYGAKVAVADLMLQVRRGEVFGFLGPNGAGKTTSIKMLLGLVAPTAGSAKVLDAPLGDVRARAKIGFLPEHFRFQDWLTGRDFLRFHGKLYGIPAAQLRAEIDAMLERVDLSDAGDRKLREYSKGMLQRIGLAQALLNQPDLIFLDEPTSGLDPLGRLLVRDLIVQLKARGTAIFLNSHLLSEVEVTCDRVAFVKRGVVVRQMALAEHSEAVEVSLRLGSISADIVHGLTQFGADVRAVNDSVRMRVTNEARLPELTRWLVGQGVDVYHLGADRKSLEALFLEVMGEDERPG